MLSASRRQKCGRNRSGNASQGSGWNPAPGGLTHWDGTVTERILRGTEVQRHRATCTGSHSGRPIWPRLQTSHSFYSLGGGSGGDESRRWGAAPRGQPAPCQHATHVTHGSEPRQPCGSLSFTLSLPPDGASFTQCVRQALGVEPCLGQPGCLALGDVTSWWGETGSGQARVARVRECQTVPELQRKRR